MINLKDNKNKIILDLCGGTGAWSKPYKDAGYQVYVITLPEYDITKTLIHEDRIGFKHSDGTYRLILARDVYGILAAPPCTEFSRAKSTTPRDFRKGMVTVEACLKIIWAVQLNHRLTFWALENPMGMLRRFLGRPQFMFTPWWFGDPHQKTTDLWGWFKKPKRTVKIAPSSAKDNYPSGNPKWFGSPKCPDEFKHLKLSRAGIRSITPPGFAQAFFKANQ